MNAEIHTSVFQILSELSNLKFWEFVNSQYLFAETVMSVRDRIWKLPILLASLPKPSPSPPP